MNLWQLLSEKTGTILTKENYYDWLNGGVGYDEFDKVVKSFLGDALYNAGAGTARIISILQVKLDIQVRPKYEESLAKAIIKDPERYQKGFTR